MSFKRTKVVMLPTYKKALNLSPIVMFNDKLFSCYSPNYYYYDGAVFQNLYFLSDDEIELNDWHYDKKDTGNEIKQWKGSLFSSRWSKKIIATTDKSLTWIKHDDTVPYPKGTENCFPQPSETFIYKFIDAYMKSNPITEVMVEYNHLLSTTGINKEWLKINPKDNTITIRKMKDSWSRQEVIELFKKFSGTNFEAGNTHFKRLHLEKWIEENL